MDEKSPGSSILGKLALALLLISFVLIVAFCVYMMATGVGVPYQDPTPAQVKYERFHNGIAQSLFVASALSVLATFHFGMAWIFRWFFRIFARVWVQRAA